MRSIAVVGASLAGLSTARALRAAGFDGRLTIVGDEPHLPYDRPPLSKSFLTGTADVDDIALVTPADELGLDWRLGVAATGFDATALTVRLSDGGSVTADGVVIATGARPRRLPGTAGLAGVHYLRTLDDALALRAALQVPARVVIVGSGFVGAEVATSASVLGHQVTVVEALRDPFDAQLGRTVGAVARRLPREQRVDLRTGVGVRRVLGTTAVEGVELDDGTVLGADVLVVGIGAVPSIDWLDGSSVECLDGVLTDAYGITAHPRVAAVGDVARYPSRRAGRSVRVEHWTHALEMPRTAAKALLSGPAGPGRPAPYDPLPYFWSDQYGVKIQAAGHLSAVDELEVVDGDLDSRRFTALCKRGSERVGVVAFDSPKSFTALRRELAAAAPVQEVV